MPVAFGPTSCVRCVLLLVRGLSVSVRFAILPLATVSKLTLNSNLTEALEQSLLEASLELLGGLARHGDCQLTLAVRLVTLVNTFVAP